MHAKLLPSPSRCEVGGRNINKERFVLWGRVRLLGPGGLGLSDVRFPPACGAADPKRR